MPLRVNQKWMTLCLVSNLFFGVSYAAPAASATKKSETLSVLSSANEPDVEAAISPAENKVMVLTRPLISGLWAMSIPGAKCLEYYNFLENGNFVVKSADEWSAGIYAYQLPAVGEKTPPILAMRIQYDNLKKDCSGNAVDQRGEEQQHYVKWQTQSNIAFCETEDDKKCFATLRKVLP